MPRISFYADNVLLACEEAAALPGSPVKALHDEPRHFTSSLAPQLLAKWLRSNTTPLSGYQIATICGCLTELTKHIIYSSGCASQNDLTTRKSICRELVLANLPWLSAGGLLEVQDKESGWMYVVTDSRRAIAAQLHGCSEALAAFSSYEIIAALSQGIAASKTQARVLRLKTLPAPSAPPQREVAEPVYLEDLPLAARFRLCKHIQEKIPEANFCPSAIANELSWTDASIVVDSDLCQFLADSLGRKLLSDPVSEDTYAEDASANLQLVSDSLSIKTALTLVSVGSEVAKLLRSLGEAAPPNLISDLQALSDHVHSMGDADGDRDGDGDGDSEDCEDEDDEAFEDDEDDEDDEDFDA